MTYGITEQGFVRKTAEEIQDEVTERFKSAFGDNIKTIGGSVFGNIIGIVVDLVSDAWEVAEASYYSQYRETSTGTSFDNAIALVAKSRLQQQKSTVTLEFTNDDIAPVTVPAGTVVKQSENNVQWQTLEDVEVPAADTAEVSAESVDYGPFPATIGSIDTIVNAIAGIESVTNTDAAIEGRETETVSEARERVARSLVSAEGGTGEAVANRLREEIDGVTYVAWRENREPTTEDGLRPHSLEFTVIGGDDQDIGDLIWQAKPGGIATNGTEEVTVTDDFGTDHIIYFNRGTNVTIYFIANLTTTSDYPDDGDDLVKAALVDLGDELETGDDVYNWKAIAALGEIPGITAVTILQGTAPAPGTSANITITSNQKANIITANITVNS
jgi:uncharacterized phage protein gp47/JayE